MSIELDESVENLTINKTFFLQSLQSASKIEYHAILTTVIFVIILVIDEAAAKEIIAYPKDRSEHRQASETILVDLLVGYD